MPNRQPSPAFIIRLARTSDVPEMARLFSELGYAMPVEVLTRRFAAFNDAGQTALIAEDDSSVGHLLGVATLHATPVLHRAGSVGRVTALVVDVAFRGCGIGRALMEEAERWAATQGCALFEVTSNQRRVDAHKFYERLGYERTSYRFARAPHVNDVLDAGTQSHER